MGSYKGMRWWKCDLHMHTPYSHYWREEETKLHQEDPAESKLEVARSYLRRCHEIGLEIIAITEHNFAPDANKSFITSLLEVNKEVADECGKSPIQIFPGFEVEAHVGMGAHVIVLFGRDTDLAIVDSKLTSIGLEVDSRYEHGRPLPTTASLQYIFDKIQSDKQHPGLVIAAHPSDAGIFDNDRVADWLQQVEYKNAELLALEIPKQVKEMSCGWQRLFGNGTDCHDEWRRIRKIACIMSSDCYRLDTGEADDHNFIGYRHTWIKMSQPTMTAIRQAFLDPDARIAFGPHSPDQLRRHSRINALTIEKTLYLEDQAIEFAPGLTCIIGGRGTGKSTLFEYIRKLLNKNDEAQNGTNTASQVHRAKETLRSDSRITLNWSGASGESEIFEAINDAESAIIGREILDPNTVFGSLGVHIFSQRQINDAGQPARAFQLIETILGKELAAAIEAEEPVRSALKLLLEKEELRIAAEGKLCSLEQEVRDLQRQLQMCTAVEDEADQYRLAKELEAYLKDAESVVLDYYGQLETIRQGIYADNVDGSSSTCFDNLPNIDDNWPEARTVKELTTNLLEISKGFAETLSATSTEFRNATNKILKTDANALRLWAIIEKKQNDFLKSCEEQGITPEDVSRIKGLDELIRTKIQQREEKRREVERLTEETAKLSLNTSSLEESWFRQFEVRKDAIRSLVESVNTAARSISGQRRLLDYDVVFQGQLSDFESRFWNMSPDGRTTLGRAWFSLGRFIFFAFLKQDGEKRLWSFVNKWLEGANFENLTQCVEYREDLKRHLNKERLADWKDRRLVRVADYVDFTLYRQDKAGGEEIAGKLSEGKLSDGQRNTVVLALLLVKNDGPILIDQPEDDIDSDFIFRYLVPVLRDRKNRRQIILVSHNSNIVVNGDADLVYALEFRAGKGRIRAQGGLDIQPVHDAVLDIMEGSEDAFRRRREKYGF